MTEVDIFDVEENVRFLMHESWFNLNRFSMYKHPSSGTFWNSKENFEPQKRQNSISGNTDTYL